MLELGYRGITFVILYAQLLRRRIAMNRVAMKQDLNRRSCPRMTLLLLLLSLITSPEMAMAQEWTAPAASIASEPAATIGNTTPIPPAIATTLQQDLSQRTGMPASQLRLMSATRKTWNNGCLGLAKPDEMCTQMMINGWQVVFANGDRRWVYRTDGTGRTYRLEPVPTKSPRSSNPAPSVANLPKEQNPTLS